MADFFYPLLFLTPGFDGDAVECGTFRLARRKWETSIFDFATLATRHKLHLSYQAMDVFLSQCNMELRVSGKPSFGDANEALHSLRVALYSTSVSPFLCPFVTTHSINEYSGINSRDSEALRSKMYPGMEVGLTSDAGTLEAWPLELSFECKVIPERLAVSEAQLTAAVQKAAIWNELLSRFPQLKAIADATVAAPKLGSLGQSLLHIWSGLEALFPTVSTEVAFRIALYIAQLAASSDRLSTYESVRAAYGVRSKVAHGARSAITTEDWNLAWGIMMESLNALVRRNDLPTEQALMHELLA